HSRNATNQQIEERPESTSGVPYGVPFAFAEPR
ncbi:MAG: hypothetical protein K0S86_5905, partial [Geminicoccaceae bacterium]|nr:hypothetical protein [Geminicoccaceae bacterium]